MNCRHLFRTWRETSYTAGGWNVEVCCASCGCHIAFARLADVVGAA